MQASLRAEITHFQISKKETHHNWKRSVNGEYVRECKGCESITKDSFESYIQDINLKVKIEVGKAFNRNDKLLSCELEGLGCGSKSLDHCAYTWEVPKKYILYVLNEKYSHIKKRQSPLHSQSRLLEKQLSILDEESATALLQQRNRSLPNHVRLNVCCKSQWWF